MVSEIKDETKKETTDPFADISKLRMSQEFADEIGVEKLITKIAVGKPDKQWWVRVHEDPAYRIETALIELKERKELYLVAPEIRSAVATELFRAVIFTGINRQGVVFLWVVRMPGPDGKQHDCHKTALIAATTAMKNWVRITWNQSAMNYDVLVSRAKLEDPEWPNKPFSELLKIAFGEDRYINSADHPVLKELRGEA
jgi:hypothetical protein